jgi:phosphoglucosamine mutase
MSNGALDTVCKQLKIPFIRVDVGDKNILAELKKRNWQLGSEPSGHILDLKKTISGDGIIAALQVLTVMVDQQSSLHSLTASLNKYPQMLVNIQRNSNFCYTKNKSLIEQIKQKALANLSDNGRILIRPSGTENLIRILVEDSDPVLVEKMANSLKEDLLLLM